MHLGYDNDDKCRSKSFKVATSKSIRVGVNNTRPSLHVLVDLSCVLYSHNDSSNVIFKQIMALKEFEKITNSHTKTYRKF